MSETKNLTVAEAEALAIKHGGTFTVDRKYGGYKLTLGGYLKYNIPGLSDITQARFLLLLEDLKDDVRRNGLRPVKSDAN